jgi:hypothetical protein
MGPWAGSEAQGALEEFAGQVMSPVLEGANRATVEQAWCFAAAVWNAVVMLDALNNPVPMTEILRRLNTLDEEAFGPCVTLVDDLCGLKETHYRDCLWVYRNVHVVRADKGLDLKAEALPLADWLHSREPLFVGLVA